MPKRAILPVAATIVITLVYYGTINNQRKLARQEVKDVHLDYVRKQLNIIRDKQVPPDSLEYYKGKRDMLSELTDKLIKSQ